MPPPSIRTRLTLWYSAVLGAVLIVYSLGIIVVVERMLDRQLQQRLRDDMDTAEQMLVRAPDGAIDWRDERSEHDHDETAITGRWLEVRGPDGALLYARPGPLPRDVPLRRLTRRHAIGDLRVTLTVARWNRAADDELRILRVAVGFGIPVALALAGVGGWFLARRAFAPVAEMARSARAISAERLDERLPVPNPRDELGRMAVVFNDTLSRLQASFEQLRRFTADASHELRTPLTAIRSVGEVGLRDGRTDAEYREIIGSMLEEADRLTSLIDGLLMLARADDDAVPIAPREIELGDLAREVVGELGILAEEKRQHLAVEQEGSVRTWIDPVVLRRALVNVVHNAIKFTPDGGEIRIIVRDGASGPQLEVADNGPGVPEEHRERVFERFHRVDESRARASGGTGLGLAIAQWAVVANGGTITLSGAATGGCCVRIELPPERPTSA